MNNAKWEPGLCTECFQDLGGKHICYWQTKRVCPDCYTYLDHEERYPSEAKSQVQTALRAALIAFFGLVAVVLIGNALQVWLRS